MDEDASDLFGVGDRGLARFRDDLTRVAHLTAAFGIERGLVERDVDVASRRIHGSVTGDQADNLALSRLRIITEEVSSAMLVGHVEPQRRCLVVVLERRRSAGLGLLFFHGRVEASGIYPIALFAQRVLGQIEGEAVGIVEFERGIAGQVCTLCQTADLIVQQFQATVERRLEPDFFVQQRFFDQLLALTEFGIGPAHLLYQFRHQFVHDRVFRPERSVL